MIKGIDLKNRLFTVACVRNFLITEKINRGALKFCYLFDIEKKDAQIFLLSKMNEI